MTKRGLLNRFKILSKPTGKVQWFQAIRATILVAISGLIASFLGFNSSIQTIMLVTLLATIIIETPLPIKKVVMLAVLGFIMTTLAFISISLSIDSLPVFIFFTVVWAFFSISMYIFGDMEGSLGFSFFLTYFIAVLLVNSHTNTFDWISYTFLSYAVASILFIPKLWVERKRIRELVTVGFVPESTIQNFLNNLHILTGIPLNSNNYDIFKLSGYFKILRNYGGLVSTRMSSAHKKVFNDYLNQIDNYSIKIEEHYRNKGGPVDLKNLDGNVNFFSLGTVNEYNKTAALILESIKDILKKSNELISRKPVNKAKTISIKEKSFRDVMRANFNLKNLYIRHAIRFTLAMTIGLIFIFLTHERSAIWITMGILIILKPDITSTVNNLIQRVGFNFIAIILAIILAIIFPQSMLLLLAILMLFLFRAFYPNYMGFSVMSMTIFIVLVWPTGTVFDNAIARLFDIAMGGIIAYVCAYVIFPSRITVNLPEQFSKTIKSSINYSKQILISSSHEFDKKRASECLSNYILEENNLDAAIKKLEDTYENINDDVNLYQNIISANIKLSTDLTALARVLNDDSTEISRNSEIMKVIDFLDDLNSSVKEGIEIKASELSINNKINGEFEQLLNWVISDINLIVRGIEIAHDTNLFERYTKLS